MEIAQFTAICRFRKFNDLMVCTQRKVDNCKACVKDAASRVATKSDNNITYLMQLNFLGVDY